jgi:ABC-type Fe3+-hydroxamate transport system substrate-binding protein
MRRILSALLVSVVVAACASTTSTPSPVATASAIKIRIQADEFCPLAKLNVPKLTVRLDPEYGDQVWATTDDGTRYGVWWPKGFQIGERGGPVVLDRSGNVAAADGDVILFPDRGFPLLRGRAVCFGSGSLYVMASIPA